MQVTNEELARIRPGKLVETFDGYPLSIIKFSFVNNIWSFLTMLRHYVFWGEPICGNLQLLQIELTKTWPQFSLTLLAIFCNKDNIFKRKQEFLDKGWCVHVRVCAENTKTKNNTNLGQRIQGQKVWGGSGTSRKRI